VNLFWLSYLLPIPFMALWGLRTDRLDRLWRRLSPAALAIWLLLTAFLYAVRPPFFVAWEIFALYSSAVCLGTWVFLRRCHLPQALSLSLNLCYFGSLYWELPIHVWTVVHQGYVDRAAYLHLLHAVPVFFVAEKVRLPEPAWRSWALLLLGLAVSALFLLPLVLRRVDIWAPSAGSMWAGPRWLLNRAVCLAVLLYAYGRGEVKK